MRIQDTELTRQLGYACKIGQVYGVTNPTVTHVEVIGDSSPDHAFNVCIDEVSNDLWFAPELIEFVDHAPGTNIKIGDQELVRKSDGSWEDA